jgi:hypothetical protein
LVWGLDPYLEVVIADGAEEANVQIAADVAETREKQANAKW